MLLEKDGKPKEIFIVPNFVLMSDLVPRYWKYLVAHLFLLCFGLLSSTALNISHEK